MLNQVTDLDLRLLRIFVAIVECGGFAAATSQLNLSGPTVSNYMHDLELRFSMRLCERGRSGFRLTHRGKTVYAAAKQLFESLEVFRTSVVSGEFQLGGELTVGIADNTITHRDSRLHQAIRTFFSRENSVFVNLCIDTPRKLETGVLDGTLHIAISPLHRRTHGIQYTKLFSETERFYCGREHTLFGVPDSKITIDAIRNCNHISRGFHKNFERHVLDFPNYRANVFSMEAAAILILSGMFVGFLPTHLAQPWIEQGLMRVLMPKDLSLSFEFYLIERSGKDRGLAIETFISDLLDAHSTVVEAK